MSDQNLVSSSLDGWVLVQVAPQCEEPAGIAVNIRPLPDYLLGKLVGELQSYSDGQYVTIGRGVDCQIRPDSLHVSRRHCALVLGSKGMVAIDLGSRNGFLHNGSQIGPSGWVVIEDGDSIAVHSCEWTVRKNATDQGIDVRATLAH